MLDWLRRILGPVSTTGNRRGLRSSIDVANPDRRLDNHFANADCLSAKAANSPTVRKKLRDRCRYEYANNSYCQGMGLTVANELIGRGPRPLKCAKEIKQIWNGWAEASGFNSKLHTMAQTWYRDGESPGRMFFNPMQKHALKLSVDIFEADRLATPDMWRADNDPNEVDGIKFDEFMNPVKYCILRNHPGDSVFIGGIQDHDWIDARWMLHLFRADRPGQVRGLPPITPCLGLFAQLRRWTIATLSAAEAAADVSMVLFTENAAETEDYEPDAFALEHGMVWPMPQNWKPQQIEAKHPTAMFDMFKRELLKEIGRCLCMPFNVIAGDSSMSNFASGRLDFQQWTRMLRVGRREIERQVVEPVFDTLMEEAEARGLLPAGVNVADIPHQWYWDTNVPHVDPIKEGTGDSLALANCTDTLEQICAEQGYDVEEILEQRGKEVELMRKAGLDIYLPDFEMNIQKEIAEGNDDETPAKASVYDLIGMGGRN